jgi:hypothetical protein
MDFGSIVILDALGFKGIWRKHSVDLIARRLRDARGIADRAIVKVKNWIANTEPADKAGMTCEVHVISDTVIFAVLAKSLESDTLSIQARDETMCAKAACVATATTFAGVFLGEMMRDDPPIVFRGCVSCGDMLIDGPILLGPAVDDAAEKSQLADGGFVWCTSSACKLLSWDHTETQILLHRVPTFEYEVPLRSGGRYKTRVVNPFHHMPKGSHSGMIVRTLATFDDQSLDVEVKKQNTEAMLKAARAHYDEWSSKGYLFVS